jgi:hypothetical protein
MKTKQKAPRSRGSTSSAAASSVRSGSSARRAVTSAVSVVSPPRELTAVGIVAPAAVDEVAQLGRVGEVAVMGERHGPSGVATERGLGVLPGRRAGGGVAAVADGEVAAQ